MIILIGNKADLEAQRDVTYEEAKQFAEENGGFLLRLNGFFGSHMGEFLRSGVLTMQIILQFFLFLSANCSN